MAPLLEWSDEHEVSTRDRLASTGADARIEASVTDGELRLPLPPAGRNSRRSIEDRSLRVMTRLTGKLTGALTVAGLLVSRFDPD